MSKNNQSEFEGTIVAIREVEDCIRATKKYTEGIGTVRRKHPIQGAEFPSKKFIKYYEVYPEVEVNWDMPASVALDWLWGETPCIDVLFNYDYRANKAAVVVKGGRIALKQLGQGIPGFEESLAKAATNGSSNGAVNVKVQGAEIQNTEVQPVEVQP